MGFFENLFKRKDTHSSSPTNPQIQGESAGRVTDSYFSTMVKIQGAISQHDFGNAAKYVRENLAQIPDFVKENRVEYGSFDIRSIPGLEQGGTILALAGDSEGLAEMKRVVNTTPELKPWIDEIEKHEKEIFLFPVVLKAVVDNPGCEQTEVKKLTNEIDGRIIASVLSYLEKAGKITRIKNGKSNRLYIAGGVESPGTLPKRKVETHRKENTCPNYNEINIASLKYIPLPRSPLAWGQKKSDAEKGNLIEPKEAFEVQGLDWKIFSIEKLTSDEKPDTAFRKAYPTNSGLLMIDDLGKADGFGQIEASAIRYDRDGVLVAKKPLMHSVYRTGVHPLGRGLILMSKNCIAHAYDENLNMILETSLIDSPEAKAAKKRFEIPDDQFKNHIRCVEMSQNATRYLVTIVDEAWCIDFGGHGLWGTKLPFKEGWTKVATPSPRFGTSKEVSDAIDLMNLSFPVGPDAIKQRYRELARKWHPDINPNDPQAEEKMKRLNGAIEVLTGIDQTNISTYTGVSFSKELSKTQISKKGINVTVTMSMQVDEKFAADWIYAAGFAAGSDKVYLAGYSGRIILVDENGDAVRVYDIGSVPRRIVDTGEYLYLLTDTRLYVLRDDTLCALVDVFDGSDFIVAQNGFGLLGSKRLKWFEKDGRQVGEVFSKEPIRRVYDSKEGLIIETRQRRAIISGVPKWWESNL